VRGGKSKQQHDLGNGLGSRGSPSGEYGLSGRLKEKREL